MTNDNGVKTLEETEAELKALVTDDASTADMTLDNETVMLIKLDMRKALLVEYTRMVTYARLNRKVESEEVAKQQEEAAKKTVRMVHELDKEIAELRRHKVS